MHLVGLLLIASAFWGSEPTLPDTHKKFERPQEAVAFELKTSDKATLKGDIILSKLTNRQFPRSGAVILIHGEGAHRKELWDLQRKIASWGASTMVVDLRGCGDSPLPKIRKTGKQAKEASTNSSVLSMLEPIQIDIESSVDFLRKKYKNEIDPNRITLIGFDLSAAAAIRYAGEDLSIKGVGFFSPEKELKGFHLVNEAKKLRGRQLFLVGANSAEEKITEMNEQLKNTVKTYAFAAKGEAVGIELLSKDRGIEQDLKIWLKDCGALSPGP